MLRTRPWLRAAAVCAATALVAASCANVTYKLPDEYLSDGDLLAAAISAAAAKFAANPLVTTDAGPYVLETLASEDEAANMLYQRLEDAFFTAMSERGLQVRPEATEDTPATVIKYRFVECRIVNAKAGAGRVKRVGRAVVHVRIYGKEAGELFWAGEYTGQFENVVPSSAISKLTDTRVEQIGPEQAEAGQNPFIEPLLVTGITGALIYLFAISASAQ